MKKKVVIVGGGFAGLNLAKNLSKNKNFEIKLVDVNNYHFFPPLLYQVASSFIDLSNISYPFRRIFQGHDNVRFHMGSLQNINTNENYIETEKTKLDYDYLVLAMGTESNFFGNKNIEENSLPMKTIPDSLALRNHVLLTIEECAENNESVNIVIAGGGPTGVELAGVFAEMKNYLSNKEYPEVDPTKLATIYLIEGSPTLLGPMSQKAQSETHKVLEDLGVKIITNTLVKDYVDNKVILGDGCTIETKILIWTSGVIAKQAPGLSSEILGRGRRIMVDEVNQVIGTKNIFCIGDQSIQNHDSKFVNGHPQLAQVAIQQGLLLSKNLEAISQSKTTSQFRYNDKGSMAIISKYKAVVDLPKGFLKGFFAWLVWLFIHIIPLVGYGNRLKLALNWVISFTTNNPSLRLLIRHKSKD
ncbi:NAD(P)/FAD-dependent oxidoreductase [Chryseobacterium scophthalmum]|uniref:NAD(P)/FAD-dependent oxidoreductase n=1 Tax=Chryseobacterium scophthalmum TaxID=59733 RepID=UPI001AEBCCB6|nr:NAD(P)/FAD-dependent oxidoreductase [Chryseobacterium scophthalmum]